MSNRLNPQDSARSGGPDPLTGLPSDAKVRMINTLLDGWVSSEDLSAIESVCSSARPGAESAAIRAAVTSRIAEIISIGQRTRARLALGRLP